VQEKPVSIVHVSLQPSFASALPSSQASSSALLPSPQAGRQNKRSVKVIAETMRDSSTKAHSQKKLTQMHNSLLFLKEQIKDIIIISLRREYLV
jgi:hypothetical protein